MRLLVAGDRFFNNVHVVERFMLDVIGEEKDVTIISGGCRGVDTCAELIAAKYNWKMDKYVADWSVGKSGGVIRNRKMVLEGKPDVGLFIITPRSVGTLNTLSLCREKNIKCVVQNVQ